MNMKRLLIATDNLIEQQFYKAGADTIVGRTPEISVRIKNSGLVIKRFKELFYEIYACASLNGDFNELS